MTIMKTTNSTLIGLRLYPLRILITIINKILKLVNPKPAHLV